MEDPTDKDLLECSLRKLSKGGLSPHISSGRVLSIYLRWLEIHRQESSKATYHWPNTLLHWSQALKNRGFGEDELIREVDKWKEENGPFRSFLRRYPPVAKDISKAFEESPTKQSKPTWDPSWKMTAPDYNVPPPRNYICNRCGKGGHHLQVCPTNMDPSFDQPPDDSYVCIVCSARGEHYKSLCPYNGDPHSLAQKRKRAGYTPPSKVERSNGRNAFGDWTHDRAEGYDNTLCRRSISQSPAIEKEKWNRGMGHDLFPGKREVSTDSDNMGWEGTRGDRLGKRTLEDSPTKQRGLVKRARFETSEPLVNMAVRETRAENIAKQEPTNDRKQPEPTERDELNDFGNSASIQRLIDRYGSAMTEVVNPIRRRPTALDMWEQDDLNRLHRVPQTTPNGSPAQSPESAALSAPESLSTDRDGLLFGRSDCPSESSSYYSPRSADERFNDGFDGDMDENMNEDMSGRLTPYGESNNTSYEDSYTL